MGASDAHAGPDPAGLHGSAAFRKTIDRESIMGDGARRARTGTRPATANQDSGEHDVLAAIAAMPEPDRALGDRLHAIIKSAAPELSTRLWYGMPAYARNGKVVCFFQSAQKFKTRYATLGFMHEANLDDGAMWPTAYALKELTDAEEARIAALVKQAVS
jgi:hypothetical protein